MEQSRSWEANRFSAGQEIPRILWNPKVHYRTHKYPTSAPILSHLDPVHIATSHFLKIHLNITLTSTPATPKWSLSLRFLHLSPVCISSLPQTCYIPRPSHSSPFDHPNNIGWAVRIIKLFIMQFSPLPCYLVPHRPNTLFWNTLSLHSFRNESEQVSHPYKTTSKIIVLCILMFQFLESKLEDKRFCAEWTR